MAHKPNQLSREGDHPGQLIDRPGIMPRQPTIVDAMMTAKSGARLLKLIAMVDEMDKEIRRLLDGDAPPDNTPLPEHEDDEQELLLDLSPQLVAV